jgi:DNA-binding NtrC family response regulator
MSTMSAGDAKPRPPHITDANRDSAARPVGGAAVAPLAFAIEDDEAVSRLIAATLAQLGIECATFATARTALAALNDRTPAIIFLDIALEQSDAIDVIKGLNDRRYGGVVQVISGQRPWLLGAVQRTGLRHDLTLLPPMLKPVRPEMISKAVADAGLAPPAEA